MQQTRLASVRTPILAWNILKLLTDITQVLVKEAEEKASSNYRFLKW